MYHGVFGPGGLRRLALRSASVVSVVVGAVTALMVYSSARPRMLPPTVLM